MLQLSYRGKGRLSVDDVEAPDLRPGEVRVRVHATGLCKSDVYGYSGVNDRRDAVLSDGDALVMGHEVAGTVDELGPGVDAPPLGTPVAVNPIYGCGECDRCRAGDENLCDDRTVVGCMVTAPGGYAESLAVPQRNVHPLSGDTPLEWGALVEPLTVGAHGVRLADPAPGDEVLVIGGGIVGLGAALAARRRVGDGVLVLEPVPARRKLCERLALRAADPDSVLGSGEEFSLAIDCVARPETLEGAVRAVPPQGLVVLVGIWEDYIPLPVSLVVGRETRIAGSYGYNQADFADVTAWVASGEVGLSPVIEHRVGFDAVIDAFDAYANGSLDAVRTLFQPALKGRA
jgi:threonine dehydrogenase-like Zn-dependent dehydrogenase